MPQYEGEGELGPDVPLQMTAEAIITDSGTVKAKKRFHDEAIEWKELRLERPPSRRDQRRWQTAWNPHETCSWEPEDLLIENFAGRVRHRALAETGLRQERVEEFTTSFKDGLHLRETLRNAHLGKIFVKETPPIRGQVGAVVIIYEPPSPERFPWKITWFSEHEWESTLSFLCDRLPPRTRRPGYRSRTLRRAAVSLPATSHSGCLDRPRTRSRQRRRRAARVRGFVTQP